MTEAYSSSDVQNFLDSNGGVVVVECYMPSSGASRMNAHKVQESSRLYGVPYIRVNVETQNDLANSYNITAAPTLLVVQSNWNNVIQKSIGAGRTDEVFKCARQYK